jgi:hypothetical protein
MWPGRVPKNWAKRPELQHSSDGDISMTPEELRLECLKLVLQSANASGLQLETSQLIARARAYADFVMRQNGHGGADGVNGASVPRMTRGDGLRDVPSECRS